MGDIKASFFLAVYGLLLLSRYVDMTSLPPTCGPGQCSNSQDSPLVQRVMFQKCNSSLDGFCFHGECIQIVDIPEPQCKCHSGYLGHRCEHLYLDMINPLITHEHIILTVVCVGLLLVGIAGILYFTIKCYMSRKNRSSPPEKKYQEVQMA